MDATGQAPFGIGDRGDLAETVDGDAADRRQEDLKVGPGDHFREHATGFLEQRAAQVVLVDRATLGHAGQVPDRLDRGLDDTRLSVLAQDSAIWLQPPGGDRLPQLRQVYTRPGHRDRRPDVPPLGQSLGEDLAYHVPIGVERDDLVAVRPSGMRTDDRGRRGIGQVGNVHPVEAAGGNRKRAVERVTTGVGPDRVAPRGVGKRPDDRTAPRAWRLPTLPAAAPARRTAGAKSG